MERIICIIIGYVFGMFQTAFFYGKMYGIDIREHGSGNAGTTNTLRVLGTKAGLIVFAGDVLKCMIAVWITTLIFKGSHADEIYLLKLYTAAGAILGHNYPFYLKFKGGKGIAATAGLILAFHPYSGRIRFILWCVPDYPLCIPGISSYLCRTDDRNGDLRADGTLWSRTACFK